MTLVSKPLLFGAVLWAPSALSWLPQRSLWRASVAGPLFYSRGNYENPNRQSENAYEGGGGVYQPGYDDNRYYPQDQERYSPRDEYYEDGYGEDMRDSYAYNEGYQDNQYKYDGSYNQDIRDEQSGSHRNSGALTPYDSYSTREANSFLSPRSFFDDEFFSIRSPSSVFAEMDHRVNQMMSMSFGGSSLFPSLADDLFFPPSSIADSFRSMRQEMRSLMQEPSMDMQSILEETVRALQTDPACRDALGDDLQLDPQPFAQAQASSTVMINGQHQQETKLQLRVRAFGSRGSGVVLVEATQEGGITQLELAVEDLNGRGERLIPVIMTDQPPQPFRAYDRSTAPPEQQPPLRNNGPRPPRLSLPKSVIDEDGVIDAQVVDG